METCGSCLKLAGSSTSLRMTRTASGVALLLADLDRVDILLNRTAPQ